MASPIVSPSACAASTVTIAASAVVNVVGPGPLRRCPGSASRPAGGTRHQRPGRRWWGSATAAVGIVSALGRSRRRGRRRPTPPAARRGGRRSRTATRRWVRRGSAGSARPTVGRSCWRRSRCDASPTLSRSTRRRGVGTDSGRAGRRRGRTPDGAVPRPRRRRRRQRPSWWRWGGADDSAFAFQPAAGLDEGPVQRHVKNRFERGTEPVRVEPAVHPVTASHVVLQRNVPGARSCSRRIRTVHRLRIVPGAFAESRGFGGGAPAGARSVLVGGPRRYSIRRGERSRGRVQECQFLADGAAQPALSITISIAARESPPMLKKSSSSPIGSRCRIRSQAVTMIDSSGRRGHVERRARTMDPLRRGSVGVELAVRRHR